MPLCYASSPMATYNTVIFDFDGTIADTLESARIAYNGIALSSGFKQISPEDIPNLREKNLNEILKILGISKLQTPSLLIKGRALIKDKISKIPLIEGMKSILLELRSSSKRVGILTSNSVDNVQMFLEVNQLSDCVNFIQSTSTFSGKSKCLKRIIKVSEGEGNQKSGMIYVGDEVRDVEACQKVGLDVAAVTWGVNARVALLGAKPSYLIEEPAELLRIIG